MYIALQHTQRLYQRYRPGHERKSSSLLLLDMTLAFRINVRGGSADDIALDTVALLPSFTLKYFFTWS